jgi:hypothetical protein
MYYNYEGKYCSSPLGFSFYRLNRLIRFNSLSKHSLYLIFVIFLMQCHILPNSIVTHAIQFNI